MLDFFEPAKTIGPLKLLRRGKVKALHKARETSRGRRLAAKTLAGVAFVSRRGSARRN